MSRRPAVLSLAALLAVPLSACGSSSNDEACEEYESAWNVFDTTVNDPDNTSESARQALRDYVGDIERSADIAEGDVRLVMRESRDYAADYAQSFSEDDGVAFFIHQNRVADACDENGSPIDVG